MPALNGFELLNLCTYKDFKLIFTTAYREYALNAIKISAFDYLLKPIDIEDFKVCIEKLFEEEPVKKQGHQIIEVQVRDGIIFIKPSDIVHIDADGNYTTFYLDDNTSYIASKSIKEYEKLLDKDTFFRCHNSHIVNLNKIKKLVTNDGIYALMQNGKSVTVSRRSKDMFLSKLKSIKEF
jgi:two-component system LytT family response regulator